LRYRYGLEDVRFLVEREKLLERRLESEFIKLYSILESDKLITLRELLHPIEYIYISRDTRYIDKILRPLADRLINTQLTPENKRIYISYGRYSPKKGFEEERCNEEYLSKFRGGYPTLIGIYRGVIYGYKPDIDSTIAGLLILKWINDLTGGDPDIYKNIKLGLKYLEDSDINRDGLVEQFENEDWAIHACRSGAVTYSNSLYLLLLENILDYSISIGDRDLNEYCRRMIPKIYEYLIYGFWMGDYIVNMIDKYGKIDMTYALDTVYIGLSSISSGEERVKDHLKTLNHELNVNGVMSSFKPINFNECIERIRPYTHVNGGVYPKLNILFARILVKYGYVLEAAKLLRNIYDYIKYKWFNPHNPKEYGGGGALENIPLILLTINEIKRKLQE